MILFDEYIFSKWVGSCRLRSLTPSTFGVLAKITGVASWRIWSKDASRWRDGAKPGKNGGISCSFWSIRTEVLFSLFWGKRKQLNLFLCVFMNKGCVFFPHAKLERSQQNPSWIRYHWYQIRTLSGSTWQWWSCWDVLLHFEAPRLALRFFAYRKCMDVSENNGIPKNHPF